MDIKKIAKTPVNFVKNHKVAFAFVAGAAVTTVLARTINEGFNDVLVEFLEAEGLTQKFETFMEEK